jgi:uncharacterized protein
MHYTTSSGPASRPVRLAPAGSDEVETVTDAGPKRPVPRRMAMFPLSAVVFPHSQIPLHIFEPRYRELTADCLAGDSCFGTVLIARGSEVGGGDQRLDVGTRALITQAQELPDGRWVLLVRGEARIRVAEWLGDDPYPLGMVEDWPSPTPLGAESLLQEVILSVRRTRGLLSETQKSPALPAEVTFDGDVDTACWQLCAQAPLSAYDAQQVLTAEGVVERLELLRRLTGEVEQDLHRMLAEG